VSSTLSRTGISIISAAALALSLGAVAATHTQAAPEAKPAAAKASTVTITMSGAALDSATKQWKANKGTKVKVTATVKAGGKAATGKVTFYNGTKKLKAVTLKKGKATYALPKSVYDKIGAKKITVKYAGSSKAKKKNASTTLNIYSLAIKTGAANYTGYVGNYVAVTVTASYSGKFTSGYIDFWDGSYRSDVFSGDNFIGSFSNSSSKKFTATRTIYWHNQYAIKTGNPDAAAGETHKYTVSFTPVASAATGTTALKSFSISWLDNTVYTGGQAGSMILPNRFEYKSSSTAELSTVRKRDCTATVLHGDGSTSYYSSYTASNLDGNGSLVVPILATDQAVKFTYCLLNGPVAIV
jgi:hypothetical protein